MPLKLIIDAQRSILYKSQIRNMLHYICVISQLPNKGFSLFQNPRGRFDDAEVPVRSPEDRERSSEPVGKWRSNGEALEPKWRDGDSVPLLPFSHYRSYSRDDEVDVEQRDTPETTRRPFKHRYAVKRNRPRGGSSRRLPFRDESYDYELTYRDRDYDNPDEDYPRKRHRPPLRSPHDSALYDETVESAASSDGRQRGRNAVGDASSEDDREVTSARYREAFQARPNEYEHEFSDEEYLRPRPRKRRPPQNYEFALASEASAEGIEEARGTLPQTKQADVQPTTPQSSASTRNVDKERRVENALELKSLLKMQQEEGSSLSEILQRRNLTLSDLLKGKADVINALKSRIADESDEYIEEMSRVMSDSLMKLAAATVSPSWRSTQMFAASSSTTAKSVAISSSASPDSAFRVTIVPEKVAKNRSEVLSNDANRVKEGPTEKVTQERIAHDSSWPRATIPPSVSTVITTSTPSSAASSMEYYLNDDGNAGSTSDRAARLENLDEDEIMEFSDFTDFKKAKSQPATSAWPSPPSETIAKDAGSTLSIELMLNPTERIALTRDCMGDRDDDAEETEAMRDNARSAETSSPEDYNVFLEAEYRNDAALEFGEDDGKRNTVKADANEMNEGAVGPEEKKQLIDDKNEPYEKNRSSEYHQADRSTTGEKSQKDREPENHRGTHGGHYEEIISEIEPEARAEIFELFASGSAGRRLERLLKSRNMSVEELIALRQRGSSKVHLTEVSRLKVPIPKNVNGTTSEIDERVIKVDDGEIVISLSPTSDFNEQHPGEDTVRREDEARRDTDELTDRFKQDIVSYLRDPFVIDRDAENTSMSRLLDLVERDRNASKMAAFPSNVTPSADEYDKLEDSHRTVKIVDLLTMFDSLPFAKDVRRQFDSEVGDHARTSSTRLLIDKDNASVVLIDKEEKTARQPNDSSKEFHAGYVEEIVREEPNIIDVRMIYGGDTTISTANDENAEEGRKTLSKVKPSIIASGAILGVTIVVFLAIFVVCRARQKQKYTYRNTFSRAVFQGPALAARKLSNSSSLSTVMVNVVATSTTRRPERTETQEAVEEYDGKSDMDNDSLDANDSWETIPDYAK